MNNIVNPNSPAVLKHLDIFQGIIARMEDNSKSCKFWCITLVSATLFFASRVDIEHILIVALFPTSLFMFLNMYYLDLERRFRNSYNEFVKRLHDGILYTSELFSINKPERTFREELFCYVSCLFSASIALFYIPIAVAIIYIDIIVYS